MFKHFMTLFFLSAHFLGFADASPKFSEHVIITLTDNRGMPVQPDSICAIVPGWQTKIAQLHYTSSDFWTGPTLEKEKDHYVLFTHEDLKEFIVVIFLNSQRFQSTVLPRYFGNEEFELRIENNKLVDVSSFFHTSWLSYFISLFLTLIIEVLIGLHYFKSSANKTIQTYLFSFILVNAITHFLLWYIYSNTYMPVLFLELLVMVAESFYWALFFKFSFPRSFLISLFTNIMSWIIGGTALYFITR